MGVGVLQDDLDPSLAHPLAFICLAMYIRHVIYMCAVPCVLTFHLEGPYLHNESHRPKKERNDMIQNARKPGNHEAYTLHRAWGPKCVP